MSRSMFHRRRSSAWWKNFRKLSKNCFSILAFIVRSPLLLNWPRQPLRRTAAARTAAGLYPVAVVVYQANPISPANRTGAPVLGEPAGQPSLTRGSVLGTEEKASPDRRSHAMREKKG